MIWGHHQNMNQDQNQYEVAFSFLAQDEALATQINDLLQDRMSTFLYSKRQEELAGTDGEQTFNDVFGRQARLVVVLYRTGWGETPWTRIEQTAIKNRAFNDGYDFVIFVPLEEPAAVPKWLPKTQIWVGLNRWGISGAASVIDARVQEAGGSVHEESIEDRAKRLERALKFEEAKKEFHRSQEGVSKSKFEFSVLGDEIEQLIEIIKKSTISINYTTKRAENYIVILGPHAGLSVAWQYSYRNSLDNSRLDVDLWEGHPPFPGVRLFDKPERKESISFEFGLLDQETPGWKSTCALERNFNSKSLAEHILKFYLDAAEPINLKKRRII
jgi:hypothetical protein